jgi:dTMP kinase
MGLFISFEGGEGAGKSTQAALLTTRLQEVGQAVVSVREPGGTPLGEKIRPWVKGVEMTPQTELLLFAAARAQLVATVIRPSLQGGKIVIADRFADSTTAYQGYGRGLPLDLVRAANQAATGGVMPDLTFLLDQPAEQGLQRIGEAQLGLPLGDDEEQGNSRGRMDDAAQSKFEQQGLAFHRKVRSGFLKLAGEEPHRILVVDAAKLEEEIAEAVWQRVETRLRGTLASVL